MFVGSAHDLVPWLNDLHAEYYTGDERIILRAARKRVDRPATDAILGAVRHDGPALILVLLPLPVL